MPAKHPRVHAVLEPPLFDAVERLARQDGVSMSQKVRDLLVEALDLIEDEGLEALVAERRKSRPRARGIPLAEVKRRLRIS